MLIEGYTAPHANEVVVKRKRLAELEAKERAHDAYMGAMNKMRVRVANMPRGTDSHWRGYADALHDFATLIVEEGRSE